MKLLVIKISLSARVSGCFNDQRSFFHLRVNGFISAFPAISSNVHIISSILATQVSLSLHLSRSFLPSFLYLQLCSVVWQGCHKNIIIKYLVVSWVLSCKATWLNMRSFFPDWDFFPPFCLIYFSVVLGGCGLKSDDMLCVFLFLPLPHICSPLDLYANGIGSDKNTLACCSTVNHCAHLHIYVYMVIWTFFQY